MSEIEITGVFENVLGMIYSAKQKAEYQVNSTIIDLYWSIGEYVSKQIDVNGWGKSTVKALSEYILSKEPGIRGYSSQNIWRMKQFYETQYFAVFSPVKRRNQIAAPIQHAAHQCLSY